LYIYTHKYLTLHAKTIFICNNSYKYTNTLKIIVWFAYLGVGPWLIGGPGRPPRLPASRAGPVHKSKSTLIKALNIKNIEKHERGVENTSIKHEQENFSLIPASHSVRLTSPFGTGERRK